MRPRTSKFTLYAHSTLAAHANAISQCEIHSACVHFAPFCNFKFNPCITSAYVTLHTPRVFMQFERSARAECNKFDRIALNLTLNEQSPTHELRAARLQHSQICMLSAQIFTRFACQGTRFTLSAHEFWDAPRKLATILSIWCTDCMNYMWHFCIG